MDEEKKTIPTVTVSPGFSGLSIGRNLCLTLLGAGALGLMISISTVNDAALQLARVLVSFCSTGFRISGAAVLCGLLMRQDEDRRLWAGLLTRRGLCAGSGPAVSVRRYGSHASLPEPGILSKAKGG